MKKFLAQTLLFFGLLTACASGVPGLATVTPDFPALPTATGLLPTPLSLATEAVSAATDAPGLPTVEANPSPAATATPEPGIPALPQYTLDALMDYDAQILDVQQTILYPNTSGETLSEIVLAVPPAQMNDVFFLQQVAIADVPVAEYTLIGQKLTLKLPAPLQGGASTKLTLTYRLALPDAEQGDPNLIRPQIFGASERQVNLTDWYPMVVPYLPGQGWLIHEPWFYGEHLVYPLADFDVTLRFTDPILAPTIAASGEPQPAEGSARYSLKAGRTFAFALGRQMQSVSAEVEGVTVTSYYYPGAEAGGQAVLDATVKAVQTYSQLFGPYPHKTLAAVQGDFNDGMEFDGLYYLSNAFYNLYDGTEKNYLVMVAAHETSHQWWFGRVANDQNDTPWLDESLATYCERLFYEKNYPNSVAWWWSYRVDFYSPEGKIDGDVPSYGGFTPYTNATYRLGARFLEELRQRMGDEAFFAFLKDYSTQMTGKLSTPADFFRILRMRTSADLTDLYQKYFEKSY